jgi:hypothetical protein
MMTDLRVVDFSGGQTEDYLDCPPNYGKSVKDFNIDGDKRLTQRWGSARNPTQQLPTGTQAVRCAFYLGDNTNAFPYSFIAVSNGKVYTYAFASWTEINADVMKLNGGLKATSIGNTRWVLHGYSSGTGNQYPYIVYYNNTDSEYNVTRIGYPMPSAFTITPDSADGKAYIYYAVFTRQYATPYGITHLVQGPPMVVSVSNAGDFSSAANENVLNLGAANKCDGTGTLTAANGYLVNSGSLAYTHVWIYRTAHTKTIPYFVGMAPAASSSYTDNVTDAVLVTRAIFYSVGGEVDHDQFALSGQETYYSKHVAFCITDTGKMYFGICKRIVQTLTGNVDAAPGSFVTTTLEPIVTLAGLGDYAIIFHYAAIMRLEGFIDNLGNGGMQQQVVSNSIGCAARNSVVRAENKLYFISANGICMTDGFSAVNLTPHLGVTLDMVNLGNTGDGQYNDCHGVFDPETNTIRWSMTWISSTTKRVIVLHLDHTQPVEGGGAVTFWYPDPTNLSVMSLTHPNMFGCARGYIHTMQEYLKTDEVYAATPAAWITQAVVPEYESGIMSFGSKLYKKWITKLEAVFHNITAYGVNAQFFHANDNATGYTELAPMRIANFGAVRLWRRVVRLTKSMLRCTTKQIKIMKGYLSLYEYTAYATATISGVNPTTVVLNTTPPNWPADLVGGYIHFELTTVATVPTTNNYVTAFQILTRSDTTLTVSSAAALYPTASVTGKWKIKGYPKDQTMRLLGYTLPYQIIGVGEQPHAKGSELAP